ncbi:MAG TPA: flagellar hook-associated protein FlgK [Variovorax sp.]|nr:flagellar hook-associated protein FlgK [Variovorax sp.]
MSGNLFLTGLSGLNVARAALVTTAHNTANVYTAGYSRQVAQVSTTTPNATGSGFFGTGAMVTTVTRSYDRYLTAQLAAADSSASALSTYASQINRIDTLLADRTSGLQPLLQTFFDSVQGVANTPADSAARQQLISSAQALANKFRSTDQYLSDMNSSVNDQITSSASQINTFATQIANLNQQISQLSAMAGGQPPNDLLDQRDQLVSDLSKIVDVKVLETDTGKYNVFIGNGQSLVLGDRASEVAAVTSAADPTRKAIAITGPAGNQVEVADTVFTGGSLGGLMAFRAETLTPTQNAIGRLAIALGDTFNQQHGLGVDLNGMLGQDFFTVADPGVFSNTRNSGTLQLGASITDSGSLTTSDYKVQVKDVAGVLTYSVTRLSDDQVVATSTGFPIDFDGVRLDSTAGAAAAGDSFLVQPTRTGARDVDVLVRDPAKVAAASPVITGNTSGNMGTGSISAATIGSGYPATPLAANVTLSYDAATNSLSGFPAGSAITVTAADGTVTNYPAGSTSVTYSAGASISFGGVSVTVKGTPAQGDTFTISKNVGGVSDGSNALLLGSLQRQNTMAGGTSTFNSAYAMLVSEVGNKAMEVQVASKTQDSLATQIRSAQQSISGVNQDEETGNLLMYQQMYQANAKVIQTAQAMFDAILSIS